MRNLIIIIIALYSISCFSQGETVFNNSIIHEVRINSLQPSDWDSIAHRYYSKEYTPLSVQIDDTYLDSVGIRIKGNSFDPNTMSGKKHQPLRLKFGKFKSGQKFDGMKEINLHTHDLLTNFLSYNIWRNSSLIAPRTSFAKLYFDDVLIGLYMFVDEINLDFVKWNFGNNDGNLYKADEKGANFSWIGSDPFLLNAYSLETNDTLEDKSDLIALLNSIHNNPDNVLLDSISKHINFNNFIKCLTIEMFVSKTDAWYDSGHNYFIYNNPETGLFEYLPWDMDNSFLQSNKFNLNFMYNTIQIENPFLNKILNNPVIKELYYSTVCNLINSEAFDKERLIELVDDTEAMLNTAGLSFSSNPGEPINNVKEYINSKKSSIENDFFAASYNCVPSNVVNEKNISDIFIYSNPCNDEIYVNNPNEFSLKRYELYSNKGNIIGADSFQNTLINTIDFSTFESGIYFLRIYTFDGEIIIRRVIKV